MQLSIVTAVRNKDYGGDVKQGGRIYNVGVDFVDRFHRAVKANAELFITHGIQWEWIIVDWASPGAPMWKNERVASMLTDPRFVNIVVPESVAAAEGLQPANGFFEHFAKNVGLRHAHGDYVLILNGDVILSNQLMHSIVEVLKSGDARHYWRPRLHVDVNPKTGDILKEVALDDPNVGDDACVAANYGGNFLLARRGTLIAIARGFDEQSHVHRIEHTHRSAMDGEILWNMYLQGVKVEYLDGGYIHLFHGKAPEGHVYNTKGYSNSRTWGLMEYDRYSRSGSNVIDFLPTKQLYEEMRGKGW